ncbi:MAG: metallophosphoesterase [archaeon]
MDSQILKFCMERGILLDQDAYKLLENLGDEKAIKQIIDQISIISKEKIISKNFFAKNVDQIQNIIIDEKTVEKIKINLGISIEISKEKVSQKIQDTPRDESEEQVFKNIKIIASPINPVKKLSVEDFTKYFRSRYSEMKNIMLNRSELDNLVSINKISGDRQGISIIGIVHSKRVTKNKNILLTVEDLTGRISVLVNNNKPVYDKAKNILLDDIIGIKCTGNKDILFANEIIYPDIILAEKTCLEKDECAAFISDIHIGSTNFLEDNFVKFIDWLNGEVGDENQREEAKKVKYLFLTGDNVDGVGVFPGQEELLSIKDIKEQYQQLAYFLGKLRKDITIMIIPGQHDAVRVAEPQPMIDKKYAEVLYSLDNIILLSNPAMIEITNNGKRGVRVLMYHGASMTNFITEIDYLRLNKGHDTPAKVVKEMLKRRHLAPIHSSVTYIPNENKDPLLISEVPDVITTGDLHRPDVDTYNNILIVCSSCWQSMTPFEEKVGNNPDPCKVPVLNLKTKAIKILDFS